MLSHSDSFHFHIPSFFIQLILNEGSFRIANAQTIVLDFNSLRGDTDVFYEINNILE